MGCEPLLSLYRCRSTLAEGFVHCKSRMFSLFEINTETIIMKTTPCATIRLYGYMVLAVLPLVTSSAAKICSVFSTPKHLQLVLKRLSLCTQQDCTPDDSSFVFVLGGCFHDLGQEVAHPNIFVLPMIHALVQNLRPNWGLMLILTILQDITRQQKEELNKS